ncbi:hypothetical protein [Streptomyces fuscichromogenes]|uniref:Uncharacterized protein n=1 Tax=Streptomyces fuscichromogenes TaxID=1324013 RepID=A0A917XN97_9ACTN|nr:hypothetical protein [Streptomyces fuscichromogenes]GGN39305.1 hypothetical protein GCM10011578_085670 [Streptomyces fuscichromogenes]
MNPAQWVLGAVAELATVFGVTPESVRVLSPFVGGAFGNSLSTGCASAATGAAG